MPGISVLKDLEYCFPSEAKPLAGEDAESIFCWFVKAFYEPVAFAAHADKDTLLCAVEALCDVLDVAGDVGCKVLFACSTIAKITQICAT